MKIEINLEDKAVTQALDNLSGRLNDMRPVMSQIADVLLDETHKIFAQEGVTPGGWQDLRPSTIRARTNKGSWPGKILEQRGTLARSLERGYGADYAQVGSALRYAPVHYFGATIKRQGEVRLRTKRNGDLLRQKNHNNLAVFAKGSHKQAVSRAVNYQIVIPARPFLPITASGELTTSAQEAVLNVIRYGLSLSS